MSRGLSKVYLRLDQNIDQHPDFAGMVLLMCAAARAPYRGRLSPDIALRLLGKKRFAQFTAPRPGKRTCDLVSQEDGTLYLDGWDEWQEGDLTVLERVSRLRLKRNNAVTKPLPGRDNRVHATATATATAVNVNGLSPADAVGEPPPKPRPPQPTGLTAPLPSRPKPRPSWLAPYGEAWQARWGAESVPPWGEMAGAFHAPHEALGASELLARWVRYLTATETVRFASATKFTQGLGQWSHHGMALALVAASGTGSGSQSAKAAQHRKDTEAAMRAGIRGDGSI